MGMGLGLGLKVQLGLVGEEVKMIKKNNTWELVNCPQGIDIIRVKWVYKTKLNPDGTIQKHKAR